MEFGALGGTNNRQFAVGIGNLPLASARWSVRALQIYFHKLARLALLWLTFGCDGAMLGLSNASGIDGA